MSGRAWKLCCAPFSLGMGRRMGPQGVDNYLTLGGFRIQRHLLDGFIEILWDIHGDTHEDFWYSFHKA